MAIEFPTISQIQERISNALILAVNAGQLDSSKHIDPNIRNSFALGLTKSMSVGFDENNDLIKELFCFKAMSSLNPNLSDNVLTLVLLQ